MTFTKSLSKTLLFAGIVLFAFSDTASAGEPFHPFWDPFYDFAYSIYYLFGGY